jgi:hypothetical protein
LLVFPSDLDPATTATNKNWAGLDGPIKRLFLLHVPSALHIINLGHEPPPHAVSGGGGEQNPWISRRLVPPIGGVCHLEHATGDSSLPAPLLWSSIGKFFATDIKKWRMKNEMTQATQATMRRFDDDGVELEGASFDAEETRYYSANTTRDKIRRARSSVKRQRGENKMSQDSKKGKGRRVVKDEEDKCR